MKYRTTNSMQPRQRMAHPRQRGFVLVLGLWAAVIVLLLAGMLDSHVDARLEQARLIRLRIQDELDMLSTRNTLLYLLGTQRYTRAGLTTTAPGETQPDSTQDELRIDPIGGEIALDGSAYRGLGEVRFSLQDESGLIALNSESQVDLQRLLQVFDADEARVSRLLDALADYRDSNSLRRLDGAEAPEYAALSEPPPGNSALRSAVEITRVLGWREWLFARPGFRVHDWLSALRVAAFNPNVMPESLLAHLPGMDAEKAARIVALRREEPFRALPDFDMRTDVQLVWAEDQYRFFPSDTLQLRTWRQGASHANLLALQLTPLSQNGPWQITSSYRIRQGSQDDAHEAPSYLFSTRSMPAP
ncbi:MAG: general secretion pathway protein GspK [Gammaproteobacteria bacterium]|jgi:type II secretory pathway component PulK|nr:general secretion pathway protein GspK [Gammaproteobacteria bacterium]MBP6053635.1 general secretion pathway protein GspK [Pseudomonadales bacterium]MBK7170831.1 general secretion pathway protein GspK [Gammaproteobacteria bacterium]MBK7519486.1 general secretion pathway protein GspK [Gammaproteobacteria bacterium]MBK7729764.1 general secretion pathway protein GspK [Gammaproteobacteria bacterium]